MRLNEVLVGASPLIVGLSAGDWGDLVGMEGGV